MWTAALRAYRRTGADPIFGDPRGYHGVAMEGYFWRLTQPATGEVVIVIAAVCRDADGGRWGLATLAAHPGGAVCAATLPEAEADRGGLRLRLAREGRTVFEASEERLRADLGPAARVDVAFERRRGWPRRAVFGGIGPAHAVPGLSQYWHPHLLHGVARGDAVVGGRPHALDGASVYAEKNWGAGGMPDHWFWGQAHAFDRQDACVAFAGGRAGVGPLHVPAAALVVSLGETTLRLVQPTGRLRARAQDGAWHLRGRTGRHVVEVEGEANGSVPHLLPVPLPPERRRRDGAAAQHLAGRLEVRVRRRGHTVFAGTSELAGLELGRGGRD
jgi:tocopherol cyclase